MCDISSLFTAGLLSISFKQLISGTFHTSPLYTVLTRLPAEAFSSELALKCLLSQIVPSTLHSSDYLLPSLLALLFSFSLLLTPSPSFCSLSSCLLLSEDHIHLLRLTWYLVGCFRDFLGMNSSPGCG